MKDSITLLLCTVSLFVGGLFGYEISQNQVATITFNPSAETGPKLINGFTSDGEASLILTVPVQFPWSDSAKVWSAVQTVVDNWDLENPDYQVQELAAYEFANADDDDIIKALHFIVRPVTI